MAEEIIIKYIDVDEEIRKAKELEEKIKAKKTKTESTGDSVLKGGRDGKITKTVGNSGKS